MEKYISKYKYNEYNLALKKRMLAFDKFIGVHGQQLQESHWQNMKSFSLLGLSSSSYVYSSLDFTKHFHRYYSTFIFLVSLFGCSQQPCKENCYYFSYFIGEKTQGIETSVIFQGHTHIMILTLAIDTRAHAFNPDSLLVLLNPWTCLPGH